MLLLRQIRRPLAMRTGVSQDGGGAGLPARFQQVPLSPRCVCSLPLLGGAALSGSSWGRFWVGMPPGGLRVVARSPTIPVHLRRLSVLSLVNRRASMACCDRDCFASASRAASGKPWGRAALARGQHALVNSCPIHGKQTNPEYTLKVSFPLPPFFSPSLFDTWPPLSLPAGPSPMCPCGHQFAFYHGENKFHSALERPSTGARASSGERGMGAEGDGWHGRRHRRVEGISVEMNEAVAKLCGRPTSVARRRRWNSETRVAARASSRKQQTAKHADVHMPLMRTPTTITSVCCERLPLGVRRSRRAWCALAADEEEAAAERLPPRARARRGSRRPQCHVLSHHPLAHCRMASAQSLRRVCGSRLEAGSSQSHDVALGVVVEDVAWIAFRNRARIDATPKGSQKLGQMTIGSLVHATSGRMNAAQDREQRMARWGGGRPSAKLYMRKRIRARAVRQCSPAPRPSHCTVHAMFSARCSRRRS